MGRPLLPAAQCSGWGLVGSIFGFKYSATTSRKLEIRVHKLMSGDEVFVVTRHEKSTFIGPISRC